MIAVPDHNTPTTPGFKTILDPVSRTQVDTLDANAREQGLVYFRWVTCAAASCT